MKQALEQAGSFPDDLLVTRILEGEKELFELIIRRYNQRLFRIGMSVLENDAETEEAMQTTYVKAFEHLATFKHNAQFSTWLTRIMLNECFTQKKRVQRFHYELEQLLENNHTMTTPAHILANKELNSLLEKVISDLPEKYRLVFVMREIEELSVKETSDLLNIEESNVKVRLNRAKSMLKERLKNNMKDHLFDFHLSRCDRMVSIVFSKLERY